MEIIDKYIGEAKVKDFNIKDAALALTGEVETLISNLLDDWSRAGELEGFEKGDIAKMVNLAVKNIKIKKVISGF